MPLSNIFTVADFWREAVRDLNSPPDILQFEKFNLINRVCQITQGLVADAVSEAYIKDTVALFSTTCRYGTTGTFVAATGILTATMDTDFVSADIGNWITLRTGTNGYGGTIIGRTSATVVTISGDNLPTTDVAAFDTITMLGTTPTGSTLSIGSLKMLRYGAQVSLQILSTATSQVVVLKRDEFAKWPFTAPQNSNTIFWTLVGVNVDLAKGSDVASYGTLTFRYPALPDIVSLTTDYIDLLDGSMIQIGIMLLRTMIQRRLLLPVDNTKDEIVNQVAAVYRSLGGEVKKEEIVAKVEALL